MLVIRVELDMLADGKQTSGVNRRVAPLAVLAGIVEFGARVGGRVVSDDPEGSLELDAIAITSCEVSAVPIPKSARLRSDISRPSFAIG